MTRDEAIAIVHKAFVANENGLTLTPRGMLDCLIELGMPKLDEPLTAVDRFKRMLDESFNYLVTKEEMDNLESALDRAGLQITEKGK